MTKKDYIKFAALLRRTNPLNNKNTRLLVAYGSDESLAQHTRIIAGVIGIFKADNPNFDENRFLSEITNGR
jgi:hypothetical protein